MSHNRIYIHKQINGPRKDERLSQPWGHAMVLNKGPLDWESSALTTKPLECNKLVDFSDAN